ncbi:MAG TPA: L-dopachrome tautomerase-related protein [Phycisphaerae bacterium]|nr:L-dopachrome tautomerase-related protein [Phycisphaerae bacterium]
MLHIDRIVLVGALTICASNGLLSAQEIADPKAGKPLSHVQDAASAQENPALKVVAELSGAMPTGITVSHDNRIFLSFSRWGDPVDSTVVELKDSKIVPYPDAQINKLNESDPASCFVSVQSVVVDSANHLWALDSGNLKLERNFPRGPKLVEIDLATNKIIKKIIFPAEVALPATYLNDVRIDVDRGMAYITDSASQGDAGIIVVDTGSGESWRRLSGEPSVLAEPKFVPIVEGEPLMVREGGREPRPMTVGADSIALSPDGQTLYWRPLSSRRFYSIATSLLVDRTVEAEQVSEGVKDFGDMGFASDGMLIGKDGTLYLTNYEQHAIMRGDPTRTPVKFEKFVEDPRLIWPDTLSFAQNGDLYMTVNQIGRQPQFHDGRDMRQPPYAVMKIGTK